MKYILPIFLVSFSVARAFPVIGPLTCAENTVNVFFAGTPSQEGSTTFSTDVGLHFFSILSEAASLMVGQPELTFTNAINPTGGVQEDWSDGDYRWVARAYDTIHDFLEECPDGKIIVASDGKGATVIQHAIWNLAFGRGFGAWANQDLLGFTFHDPDLNRPWPGQIFKGRYNFCSDQDAPITDCDQQFSTQIEGILQATYGWEKAQNGSDSSSSDLDTEENADVEDDSEVDSVDDFVPPEDEV